jgi:hypothetical protein
LTETPPDKRIEFFREIKEELRPSPIEGRARRSLLEVDALIIDGVVVWKRIGEHPIREREGDAVNRADFY